jgi:hypothetical protein
MNTNCNFYIIKYAFLRLLITIILFTLFYNYFPKNNKYFLLLLVLLLTILDIFDSAFLTKSNNNKCTCCLSYNYQIIDKINDLISYFIVLLLLFSVSSFNYNILKYFIIYRFIGVILFALTKQSIWLIIFFDFIKEYILYFTFFGNNFQYIYFFIIAKIIFEYYFHTKINQFTY